MRPRSWGRTVIVEWFESINVPLFATIHHLCHAFVEVDVPHHVDLVPPHREPWGRACVIQGKSRVVMIQVRVQVQVKVQVQVQVQAHTTALSLPLTVLLAMTKIKRELSTKMQKVKYFN